jgi:protein gp37
MHRHNLPTWVSIALALVLFTTPKVLLAQYAISTVAGGGPNKLTALKASIGYPGSIAFDTPGNAYIADSYSSQILKVDTANNLTVVAGNGTVGYTGDGGPATGAALNGPEGVFVDASGNIFIADSGNSVIREVAASNGNISTIAGNGNAGYSGDGGPATSAQLDDPFGVFVDSAGNIFIADTDNCLIREVSGGNIATVAGNPSAQPLPCGYSGDGGLSTSAQLDVPESVFVDASDNIFIADTDNNRIRVVNTGTSAITVATIVIQPGDIQTVAGDGTAGYTGDGGAATAAELNMPDGVFVDGSENIFISDTVNSVIREVTGSSGVIATVAGDGTAGYSGDGGAATSAELDNPSNIFVDSSGDIFIADTDNYVIREVVASTGYIQTNVGNNTLAYSGDGGSALNAELNTPGEVSVDGSGDLFIADTASSVIREVAAATGDIQTVAGNGTECADPTTACGDGAAAVSAQLNNPYGMFLDAAGNVFIADTADNRIRVVNTGATAITIATIVIQPGDIATVAGNGTACLDSPTTCGDGAAATSAELASPYGVFVDSAGNIFIADTQDNVIREVTASSGLINTVVGNYAACSPAGGACGDGAVATAAQLNTPAGVFVDAAEDIFIADTFDNRIREVTASNTLINTVAGTGARGYAGDGAAATSALLDTPYGLFVDSSGDIFIADTENNVIREVVAATGFIQTVAGNNMAGFSGDGGQSTTAELDSPFGLFGDSSGDLFVADTDNSRIRKLVPSIFVTVAPNPVNVATNGQQQFTATVTGSSNTTVTWQVNGVAGGNSTVGTISTTGLYQAPAAIPTPPTVTVSGIANADGTSSGSAQATIVAGGNVKVIVGASPAVGEVYTGTTQAFSATVTGTTNSAVNWQVNGVPGGNGTFGTISTSGLYTGPATVPSPATITVKAVSQADSAAFGTTSVLIVTEPTAADPPPQTISAGGSVTYSLLLNAGTGDPNYAIKLACLQSALPPGATCSFSPSAIKPASLPVSFSLTITVPSGSASLEKPNNMRLRLYFAFVPLAGILFAGAGGRNKWRRWLWLVCVCIILMLLNACGGGNSGPSSVNPELGTYNVQVQGTTSAQPNPVTITTAGLSVQ